MKIYKFLKLIIMLKFTYYLVNCIFLYARAYFKFYKIQKLIIISIIIIIYFTFYLIYYASFSFSII